MFYLFSSTWPAKMRSSMNQRVWSGWPACITDCAICLPLITNTRPRVRQQHKTGVREQSGKKNNIKTTTPASSSFLRHANHIHPHNATQNKSETFVCPRRLEPSSALPQEPVSLFYYYDFLEGPPAKWSTCSSMSQVAT